ncbi:hypothetical protein E4U21_002909 [Claviceps maximensis]|nr:hypothetical protein E4U21_002909 [Claviceps maximensis]
MDQNLLAHSLADAFNALADQVQVLADRKTVLEHKLRFAHEQFQYLADKYAHATPEIVETLTKLQLPPHTSVDVTSPVPLPHRRATPQPSHQVAVLIRDGRRMANQINSVDSSSKTPSSSRQTFSHTSQDQTSMSTALEQDFTIEGKKGNLQCPYSKPASLGGTNDGRSRHSMDTTPHHSADPICAAMHEEAISQPAAAAKNVAAAAAAAAAGSGSSKCPIRFMDKHSAEEIAHYVETHKHALPRSHEVCLRRYQRNETQMKKMDSKYGNIVSMIEGLGHIHQPMLPDSERAEEIAAADRDGGGDSNERVEHWAHGVSDVGESDDVNELVESVDQDRTSHFERPLKEVRVGESPSRPWGISVPVYDVADGRKDEYPLSPPPAPVRMSSSGHGNLPPTTGADSTPGKCPFDHGKFSGVASAGRPPYTPNPVAKSQGPIRGYEETPFTFTGVKSAAATEAATAAATPAVAPAAAPQPPPPHSSRPAFINSQTSKGAPEGGFPQMVFTGPVFIGYPMEQAVEFMNQYRGPQ